MLLLATVLSLRRSSDILYRPHTIDPYSVVGIIHQVFVGLRFDLLGILIQVIINKSKGFIGFVLDVSYVRFPA